MEAVEGGLGTGRQGRPCTTFLWQVLFRQRYPRTSTFSLSLCPTVWYEQIAGAKINFNKSEGLQLGDWKGGISLPEPFRWSDGPIHILRVGFGPGLQLERNWSEVQAKVGTSPGGYMASKAFVLEGQSGGMRRVRLLLDPLPVPPQPRNHWLAFQRSLSKLLDGGGRPMVRR